MPEDHQHSPLDRLASLVPVDALVRQVDVNELLDRIDIEQLLKRVDLDGIVRQSVKSATRGTLDLLREQLAHLDTAMTRAADRVLRRDPPPPEASKTAAGRTAGGATRLSAFVFDLAFALVVFATVITVVITCIDFVTGAVVNIQIQPALGIPAILVWLFLYFSASWATTGWTPGMALIGLRVVGEETTEIPPWRAAVRTLVLPVSFILGLGLVGIVLGARHRALHDAAAGTLVVYLSSAAGTEREPGGPATGAATPGPAGDPVDVPGHGVGASEPRGGASGVT